jgi:predicted esterase
MEMLISETKSICLALRLLLVGGIFIGLNACTGRLTSGAVFLQMPETIDPQARYVIFLHGRLIEEQGVESPVDPFFGSYDYSGILEALAVDGNQVISEVRPLNTDAMDYAAHVAGQIETLLEGGVLPEHVTVVGFSKGGVITIRVSAQVENPQVNYVVLAGACAIDALEEEEEIVFHGRFLSIYEASDEFGQSCQEIADRSEESLVFEEIRLDTGLAHGEFYLPRDEWILPTLEWIRGG